MCFFELCMQKLRGFKVLLLDKPTRELDVKVVDMLDLRVLVLGGLLVLAPFTLCGYCS